MLNNHNNNQETQHNRIWIIIINSLKHCEFFSLFLIIIIVSLFMFFTLQLSLISTKFIRTKLNDAGFIDNNHDQQQYSLLKAKFNFNLNEFLLNLNQNITYYDGVFSDHYINKCNNNNNNNDNVVDFNEDYWQQICSSNNKFYIFSSYLDTFNRSNMNSNYFDINYNNNNDNDNNYFIRIIAVTLLTSKDRIICLYNTNYEQQFHWYRFGRMKPIREHWNLKYSAFFIYCPLPLELIRHIEQFNNINYYVSIIALSKQWTIKNNIDAQLLFKLIVPSNRLTIHGLSSLLLKTNETNHLMEKLAVCIKPLHFNYDKTINLIEFIQLNRIIGIDRFYFYNHSISMQMDNLLRSYKHYDSNLIHINQWQLPIRSQLDIRTEGIFASINDCLYRARIVFNYKYVMFIDLDEFIIPNKHENLLQLIKSVQKYYPSKIGAYSFRNGFFYLQYPNDDYNLDYFHPNQTLNDVLVNIRKNLVTLTKTYRKSQLNIHKQRSKLIVHSDSVIEIGNHFVWEFRSGKYTINIDPNLAYLHHYRVCEFGGNGCIDSNDYIIDRRIFYWKSSLLQNILNTLQLFCHFNNNTHQIINNNYCQLLLV